MKTKGDKKSTLTQGVSIKCSADIESASDIKCDRTSYQQAPCSSNAGCLDLPELDITSKCQHLVACPSTARAFVLKIHCIMKCNHSKIFKYEHLMDYKCV
uniref:Uncharacterized protein n=1 Tax=Romanomermis culicivorax TaxID=13658 RepID=A0A915KAB8_ROMCU